jgi:hypothetical protein
MRTLRNLVLAPLFVFAVACGGSTPPPTTPEGGGADASGTEKPNGNENAGADASASKDAPKLSPECESIGAKMKAVDAAKQGDEKRTVAQSTKALATALEKLSADLEKENIATPDLKTAVGELATEAKGFATTTKGMTPTFDEMDKVAQSFDPWQKKVAAAAAEYDKACEKGPKEECEKIGAELQKVPQLEGSKFGEYATALEAFTKTVDGLKPKDAKVKSTLAAMNGALKEGIAPSRKMATLLSEVKKLDAAGEQLRTKVNRVRTLCGLPAK